ncbi:MAG: hypothetical protein RBS55_09625 [Bacteroidales bacterium]|nr:hypothetical protein [Bacteroidales bacterium]
MKTLTLIFALWFCLAGTYLNAQNVGINPDGNLPHSSAGLDVNFPDKGLLIPRVNLMNTASAAPVTDPAISLLIYNTATTGDVTPGYYFWSGSTWKRLSDYLDELASESPVSGCYQSAGSIQTDAHPVAVAVSGNYAFVINQMSNSLIIYDISVPDGPVTAGSCSTGNHPVSVALYGDYAFVTNGLDNTLSSFDVSDPSFPTPAGSVNTGEYPVAIAVSGNYAYVINSVGNSMMIYNISNPGLPTLAGFVATAIQPSAVAVSGNFAYITSLYDNTLSIYNVADPASPILAGWAPTGLMPNSVTVSGTYAYVVNGSSNDLNIFDVSNPSSPVMAGWGPTGLFPQCAVIQDQNIYISNRGSNTISIYNVSDPAIPIPVAIINTGTDPVALAVTDNYAYVTICGTNSLEVYKLFCFQKIIFRDGGIVLVPETWSTINNNIYNENSGNVGIGTTTPSSKLEVAGGSIKTDNQLISTAFPGTPPLSVSSTTLVTNLNADILDGYHAGNGSGQVPVSNSTVNTNLNADLLDSYHADGFIKNQVSSDQAAGFRITGNGILNGGKLGIGITNPTGNLQVNNPGDVTLLLFADTDNAGSEEDNPRIELRQDGGIVVGALGLAGSANTIHQGDLADAMYLVNEGSNALQLGTSNQIRMTILSGGYVGIGTDAPKAPMHVSFCTPVTPFSSTSVTYNRLTPPLAQPNQSGGLNNVNSLVSIIAEGDIVCQGTLTVASWIYLASDQRLKDILGISNSLHDLDILKKIQITDYLMKDKVSWGWASHKMAIAQQVEEVYPQAVTKTKGFIPDIYEFASVVEKTDGGFLVTMGKSVNCKAGDKIRMELENKGTVEGDVVKVLNDRQFEVTSDTDISTGELFVYGKQVDDLRSIDYDAISMLNVSATQELAKQLLEAQKRIRELEAQIGEIREFLEMRSEK